MPRPKLTNDEKRKRVSVTISPESEQRLERLQKLAGDSSLFVSFGAIIDKALELSESDLAQWLNDKIDAECPVIIAFSKRTEKAIGVSFDQSTVDKMMKRHDPSTSSDEI